jgi:hypothetical protein
LGPRRRQVIQDSPLHEHQGVVKPLALFAPGVNGKLLKKQDENMSFDDMLAALKKPLPPYRFTYLIEKQDSLRKQCKAWEPFC